MFTFTCALLAMLALNGHVWSHPLNDTPGTRLNEYIRHYEPAGYDALEVHAAHTRAKRSVTQDQAVHIAFSAHNRTFNIRLKRDLNTFSDKLIVVDHHGKEIRGVDTSHVYKGELLGEPESVVFGSILEGVFEGKIISKSGNMFLEKASHFFPENTNASFHSVIYKESDVEDPYQNLRQGHAGGCGITDSEYQGMDLIHTLSSGADHPDNIKHMPMKLPKLSRKKDRLGNRDPVAISEPWYNEYSGEAHEDKPSDRSKRAVLPREVHRTGCSLFIQTDPSLWKQVSEQVGFNPEKTQQQILSLIAHHVTALNYIYRDTKFDGRVEHRNIKFRVERVKIDDDGSCNPGYQSDSNQFCKDNLNVRDFLNLHSLENYEDFCLAYMFTYRDFEGTLGLAWPASATGAPGGICERYDTHTNRSLNTGVITLANYNSRVPPMVSQLMLAHQIGHSFGSPHDYPAECRPGGEDGNYIMFAGATSGDRPNNSRFSRCSLGNISVILDAMEDYKRRNCFEVQREPFCGNKIVEDGEECDCGYDDDDCTDKCCYPRVVGELSYMKNVSAKGCQRRAHTQCSPSQGPCCNVETCMFVPASHNVSCRSESECARSSTCDGLSSECPTALPKENKTRCNQGTRLCINGECTGSICTEWNLQECFLTSDLKQDANDHELCQLACQNGTQCRSTSEFAHEVGLPPGGIRLRPGSPCDNFKGYCDTFSKCKAVEAESLFNRNNLDLETEE